MKLTEKQRRFVDAYIGPEMLQKRLDEPDIAQKLRIG